MTSKTSSLTAILDWWSYLAALIVCVLPDLPRFQPYFTAICRLRAGVISLGSSRQIGRGVSIRRGFSFSRKMALILGDHCSIKENVSVGGTDFRMGAGSVILARTVIDASGGSEDR